MHVLSNVLPDLSLFLSYAHMHLGVFASHLSIYNAPVFLHVSVHVHLLFHVCFSFFFQISVHQPVWPGVHLAVLGVCRNVSLLSL